MNLRTDVSTLGRQFQIPGEFVSAEPYGSGHINDTYRATFIEGGRTVRYIHQRINDRVFPDPIALMHNIQRVTDHIRTKLSHAPDAARRTLTLIPTHTGQLFHRDEQAHYWRTYRFIEQSRTYDTVATTNQAYQAAHAFGQFQQQLSDLPAPRLHDTIPDFHNTVKRFAALAAAIAADTANRAQFARPEIDFALRHQAITGVLVNLHAHGAIPERITHNDTKFNNILFDDTTHEAICVIDLDTVMPGLALYDFGDMVRTTTSPTAEDERDLSKVTMQFPMFEALVRGYLAAAGNLLTPAELHHLAFAGKLITFEIGLRFLTDYLAGDVYFKVHRPGHNLDRCRTQFKLVESIEHQEPRMRQLVARLATTTTALPIVEN